LTPAQADVALTGHSHPHSCLALCVENSRNDQMGGSLAGWAYNRRDPYRRFLSGLRDNICSLKGSSDCKVRAPIKTKQMPQFLIFARTNYELVMVTKDTGETFNRMSDSYIVQLVRLTAELVVERFAVLEFRGFWEANTNISRAPHPTLDQSHLYLGSACQSTRGS
jgi:hypothetical protein